MERRLLLDVVVAERTAVLQLLTREDKTLLVRRNTLLVLDLGLHILDRIGRLHLEGDRLTRQGLDEHLHDEQLTKLCVASLRFPTSVRKRAGARRGSFSDRTAPWENHGT